MARPKLLAACALLALLVSSSTAHDDDPSGLAGGIQQRLPGYRGRKVGARTEVRDVERDREVQELGRFSVAEHNRWRQCCGDNGGGRLEFGRVVAAQRQVVSGLKYYLRVVAAVEGGAGEQQVFDAVVVVKPWLESRKLLRFAPAAAK